MASSAHGIPRTTLDVDLVANMGTHHVDQMVQSLQSPFFDEPPQAASSVASPVSQYEPSSFVSVQLVSISASQLAKRRAKPDFSAQ